MKPKDGWKHATGESLIASAASILGRRHCIRPEVIFDWAKEHCPDLYDRLLKEGKALLPPDMRILVAVIGSVSLAAADRMLKQQSRK